MIGDASRDFHRPGVERAGAEDEWDDPEVGLAPVASSPPLPLCPHGRETCWSCDREELDATWMRSLLKPPTDELDPF